jgi:hypothetical protein
MNKAISSREANFHELVMCQSGSIKVIIQRTKWMMMRDEPQLCAGVA